MNIIQAISDKNLFRRFLADKNGSLKSWQAWNVALRCLYGLPIKKKYADLVLKCTGRSIESMPKEGFSTACFFTGRRSGKSRVASIIGSFEATLTNKESLLAPGETGMVAIVAPTKRQGRIIKNYTRAIYDQTPMLEREVVEGGTKVSFELSSGVVVEIMVADYRAIRGFTLLAAIVDEVNFMGLDSESKVRNATELISAIRPALSTLAGKLICVSTKYATSGWGYRQWKKHWGKANSKVLVWTSESRIMNPTLSQSVIDEAYVEDKQSCKSEYLDCWREDVVQFLPREIIESVVVKGRKELLPRCGKHHYKGFADISGGRKEDSALAISHKYEGRVIIDFLKVYNAPHNPHSVIKDMAEKLKRYGLYRVTSDNYAAEFSKSAFLANKIRQEKCKSNKSQLYLECIPIICSDTVQLLDSEILVEQFCGLERHTHSGGRDKIDHSSSGGKDDAVNAVCGAIVIAHKPKRYVGAFFTDRTEPNEPSYGSDYAEEPTKISIIAG